MKNIKLIVAYDGSDFLGWQKTKEGPSIEQTLQEALELILQEPVTLQAASRTDAGVHAEGQVVNFFTNNERFTLERVQKSLNSLLPSSIKVLQIKEAAPNFHPTLDSLGKEYRYFITNSPYERPRNRFYSWHVPRSLSLSIMHKSAQNLIGTHDFSAFSTEYFVTKKNPICTLNLINITKEKDLICFTIQGDRFLFRMMRGIVGTLVYIGCGKLPPDSINKILHMKDRTKAGMNAPAHGLHLIEVFYKKKEESTISKTITEEFSC